MGKRRQQAFGATSRQHEGMIPYHAQQATDAADRAVRAANRGRCFAAIDHIVSAAEALGALQAHKISITSAKGGSVDRRAVDARNSVASAKYRVRTICAR